MIQEGNKDGYSGEQAMETKVMGRVLTEATIENLEDLWAAKRGLISEKDIRRALVTDALVDTGDDLVFSSHANHSAARPGEDGLQTRHQQHRFRGGSHLFRPSD